MNFKKSEVKVFLYCQGKVRAGESATLILSRTNSIKCLLMHAAAKENTVNIKGL